MLKVPIKINNFVGFFIENTIGECLLGRIRVEIKNLFHDLDETIQHMTISLPSIANSSYYF
jgi:hypothetical protein